MDEKDLNDPNAKKSWMRYLSWTPHPAQEKAQTESTVSNIKQH